MSSRWYLTSVYRERIPRDVTLDLPKDESSTLFLTNIKNKGHITLHGDDSLFALSGLAGYRGGVDIRGRWTKDEIAYRCKSLLLDYREHEITFNVSLGDYLMNNPIDQAYVRYPYFSYYDLHYENLKSIRMFTKGNYRDILRMYGMAESTFFMFKEVLDHDHVYVVRSNITYYSRSEIRPDSDVDVLYRRSGVTAFVFRRKGIVVKSIFFTKTMFNVVDSFVT